MERFVSWTIGAVKQHFYDSKNLRNTVRDISVGSKTKKYNNTSMNTDILGYTRNCDKKTHYT